MEGASSPLVTQRPWATDRHWLDRYAVAASRLKGQNVDPEFLREAYSTVYRAVAFGLDGTLTLADRLDLSPATAEVIANLLRRSVPVILVTSRGPSVRNAIEQLIDYGHLSSAYMRRLYCLVHNGVSLLRHDPRKGEQPLSDEIELIDISQDLAGVKATIEESLASAKSEIILSRGSIRIKFESEKLCQEAEGILCRVVGARLDDASLHITRGIFAGAHCLDVGQGRKGEALDEVSQMIGVPRNTILCVGDQGDPGGNDFDFLNHAHAFSVDKISPNPRTCHPVLDESLSQPLKGPQGVERLLATVLLFPALSLDPGCINADFCQRLGRVERKAQSQARAAVARATAALNESIVALDCMPRWSQSTGIAISEVFDPLSGAVRLRDWEIEDLDTSEPLAQLLDIDKLQKSEGVPRTKFCMYSDSALLLRGPAYYPAWTTEHLNVETLVSSIHEFTQAAKEAVAAGGVRPSTFGRYKLILAIMDYFRNYLIILASILFSREGESESESYPLTRELINDLFLRHTIMHLHAVRSGRGGWRAFHRSLSSFMNDFSVYLQRPSISEELGGKSTDLAYERAIKPRECDHFIENATAIVLGMQKHLRHLPELHSRSLRAVGLAYGGLELPIIAAALASDLGLDIDPALAHLSLYGSPRISQEIRSTSPGYVEGLFSRLQPICLAGKREDQQLGDRPAILMDDNCTTARTLQWGRDVLIGLGVDVLGAVIIRYPRPTCAAQLADNGMPDPEVMFGFIRGMIGPSPYARVFETESEGVYRDQFGIFDKSKERIARYLAKNGTPRVN